MEIKKKEEAKSEPFKKKEATKRKPGKEGKKHRKFEKKIRCFPPKGAGSKLVNDHCSSNLFTFFSFVGKLHPTLQSQITVT